MDRLTDYVPGSIISWWIGACLGSPASYHHGTEAEFIREGYGALYGALAGVVMVLALHHVADYRRRSN
jgi:hypothetical protein